MTGRLAKCGALVAVAAGIASTAGPVAADPGDTLPASVSKVVWTVEIDGPPSRVVPVVGTVIALVDGTVVALDAATGEEAWRSEPRGGAIDILGASTSDAALVVSEAGPNWWTVTAVEASSGRERGSWKVTVIGSRPRDVIAVTSEHALALDPFGTLRARSLTSGDEVWRATLPDSCPLFVTPTPTATSSGFLVPCGTVDPALRRVVSGGYVSFDAATGEVAWSHVRDGTQAPPAVPPGVSPDGAYVHLAFADAAETPVLEWTSVIVDAATGADVAEGDFGGELGAGGWFVHGVTPYYEADYEHLGTGERVEIDLPCTCGIPVAFLADGIVWWTPGPQHVAPSVEFFGFAGGSSEPIGIDARLEWVDAVVGRGLVVLTNRDSPIVVGLR